MTVSYLEYLDKIQTWKLMATYRHWSWWLIRRGMPTNDNWWAPEWKYYGKQRAVRHLISYTVTPDPTEQMIKHHHRKEHDPPYRRLITLLGMSICIHHTGEVFSSLTSSFTFHFCDMLTRALYTKHRYRYRYLPADRIPIFFFYITAI